jgi:hypothetical protein
MGFLLALLFLFYLSNNWTEWTHDWNEWTHNSNWSDWTHDSYWSNRDERTHDSDWSNRSERTHDSDWSNRSERTNDGDWSEWASESKSWANSGHKLSDYSFWCNDDWFDYFNWCDFNRCYFDWSDDMSNHFDVALHHKRAANSHWSVQVGTNSDLSFLLFQ